MMFIICRESIVKHRKETEANENYQNHEHSTKQANIYCQQLDILTENIPALIEGLCDNINWINDDKKYI